MTLSRVAIAAVLVDAAALIGLTLLATAARVVGDAIDAAEGEDDFDLWERQIERLGA